MFCFHVSDCRYLYWFCCFLTPRISEQCHSGTDTELDQVLCTDMALQAEASSKIQSIFHPEERTTLFVLNSLVNVILAVSQQQSHRCLLSLWILTVTATQEMFCWLQRWPFLWLGWWMDLCVPSVLKLIHFTRYFEDAGDQELCWWLNPLIFQSLWPLTPLTPLCYLTPSSWWCFIFNSHCSFPNKFCSLDPNTSLQFDLHL